MSSTVIDTLAGITRGFDTLLPALRDTELGKLAQAQRALEAVARKVLAAQAELDAATEQIAGQHGYATARGLLREMHQLTPREATAREQRREILATRRSLTGEVLPPKAPAAASAFADGAIGAAHVETIAALLRQAGERLDPHTAAGVEEQLAGFARQYTPRETAVLGTALIERLAPDDREPDHPEAAPAPENVLFFGRSRRGRCKLTGEFDPDAEAAIRAMIDALSKPSAAVDGVPDERSHAQRQGEALVEAAHQVLGFGELPDCGGERPHIAVTVNLAQLEARLRGALLDYGHTLHPETARMLACDAQVIPVVLDGEAQPLDVGRARRTTTRAQRRALIARAGGQCEMPGCDRPASWCTPHHIIHWVDDGPTDLVNLTLLCRRHHTLVHRGGWHIHLDTRGHPVFTPPAVLDPERRPRPSRP